MSGRGLGNGVGMENPNILIIVSDTFRRDNLSVYGGRPDVAPNLNRFATQSSVFQRFYSCSFPTVPARADLLTGRVAFTRQGWGPLNSAWSTVAEAATANGYKTMGVTDVPFLVRSGYGYDRGFSDYIWVRGQPDRMHPDSADDVRAMRRQEADHCAPTTMRLAADWLERRAQTQEQEPFLLVVDTWDPHEPWDAPSHYVRRYRPGYQGQAVPYPPYQALSASDEDEEAVAIGRAAYLGKTSMVDAWIGYLLQRLEILGYAESTVVMFLTDHGFYFGEHNFFGKSIGWKIGPVSEERSAVGEMERSPLYEEVNHIPLLVRVPGWDPATVSGMASIPDVGATVLELVGASGCSESTSLIAPEGGKLVGPREFTVTSWPMHLPGDVTQSVDAATRRYSGFMPITITTPEWSLLFASDQDAVELYNLEVDPGQQHNVAADNAVVVRQLHTQLVAFLRGAECAEKYLLPRLQVRL
ncbi:MAG: sulfatase [Candidatus Dormibacteria bacterium]